TSPPPTLPTVCYSGREHAILSKLVSGRPPWPSPKSTWMPSGKCCGRWDLILLRDCATITSFCPETDRALRAGGKDNGNGIINGCTRSCLSHLGRATHGRNRRASGRHDRHDQDPSGSVRE